MTPTRTVARRRTHPGRPAGRWAAVGLVVLAAGAARGQPAGAESDPVVAARLEYHKQAARRAAAEAVRDAVQVAPAGPTDPAARVGQVGNPQDLLDTLRAALTDPGGGRGQALDELVKQAEDRAKTAEARWKEAYRARARFMAHVDATEAKYGFRFEPGERPRFRPGPEDWAVLAWGAFAVVVGVRLAAHEFRVDRRRWRRARAAAALLALGPAVGGCTGDPAGNRPWAERELEELAGKTAEEARLTKAAEDKAAEGWEQAVDGWAKVLAAVGSQDEAGELAKDFRRAENATRDKVWELLKAARLADALEAEAAAEPGRLEADRKKLGELIRESQVPNAALAVARVGAAAGLVVLAAAPLVWARRRRARRLAAEARVCPRCLAAGRLVRRKAQAASPQYPEVRYLECTAEGRDPAGNPVVCGYQFRASYAKLPRVCFPTVGVRASGKTQLLVTAYDRVRNGSVPTAAAVQRAPSLADKRFEKYVDEILVAHRSPDFTPHTLPYPINLHVRDTDPTGPSTVLVNLFDYAGQMMNTTVDHDALRQRAVRMDGFLLFLDPTQLYGDTVHLPGGGTLRNLSLASQVKALDDYFEDMREERGVPEGRPIPLPVAVCVTKLDLLVSENPIGGDSVPYSRELTAGGLDPGPEGPLTLDALTRRSGLVEEMFPQMFPGLNLRKKLHDYFGDQVLFFPVSSVGLVEDELGVRDLKRRTIAPYGVVEPVLWPLHMHGYQVFAG